ncbi:MAG: baseplate J/gp47 family protein, partial [Candidatus Levybacteria bacterium]|nr:baseplate J/gp47 family protein [Candidatus Levybacteria bacterium]
SIPFTVDTLLKHFNIPEILPSRIIIFNGKEDLSQEFISHTWSKSLPFLHLPQITNLPRGFDAKAVLFGATTQMGFEILEEDIPQEPHFAHELLEEKAETIEAENPIKKPLLYENLGDVDFGFAKDIDVAKMPVPRGGEFQPARNASQSEAGGEPVKEIEKEQEDIPQFSIEETYVKTKSSKKLNNAFNMLRNILTVILGLIFSIARKINIKKTSSDATSGKLRIIITVILIFVVAIITSYFLFLKTTITIIVDPEITEQNKNVLFSTTEATDPSKSIIKGEFVSVSEDGSVSTAATGKKDIGTPAKGTITIFSTLNQSKNLPEGTIIKSPNGLEFTFDSEVTIKAVASRSADEPPPPSQTTTVNITADQLGKESNLPSGTRFTVSFFETTDLVAKNDNPFSGGTKKEVTVVSKNDSVKLEDDILKQLENKAREDLQKQIGQNKILLPSFVTEILSKKSLNVGIGDEANQVTLTGTVEYQGISYDKNDLITFSKALLSKDIPPNQEVDYNNIKTVVLDMKQENDEEIEANLNIKTLLLPKIDATKMTKNLKGKSFKFTQDLFYKLPQVANVDIKLSPNLPFLPKNLPAREKNITILIKINE